MMTYPHLQLEPQLQLDPQLQDILLVLWCKKKLKNKYLATKGRLTKSSLLG